MYYYKRNIGDYHKKAGRLTILQHGAYTLLIDACYDREVFPTVDEAIDWVWASTDEEVLAVKFVLKKLFTEINGVYIQSRIQEDLDKYHKMGETNKRIALDREEKKRLNKTNRTVKSTKRVQGVNDKVPLVERAVNEAPPNQEPLTNNQEPLTNKKPKPTKADYAAQAVEIFTYWKQVMKKNNSAQLTPARLKAVTNRLKDNYTVEQIKLAIDGCSVTPHNCGQNANNKRYDCLELICRTGQQIEGFADKATQPVDMVASPTKNGGRMTQSQMTEQVNDTSWADGIEDVL